MATSREIEAVILPPNDSASRAMAHPAMADRVTKTAVDHVVVQFKLPHAGDPVPRDGDVVRILQGSGPEIAGTIDGGSGVVVQAAGSDPEHMAYRVLVSERPVEGSYTGTIEATGIMDKDWEHPLGW